MTRAITALVALFAVKLQACTAFQHSKVQSNRAMNAAPPVRLDWSSAKSATPEIGRFTTKTSRALADAGAAADAQLVGYLSQHTTHAVLQAKPEIDALMAK